MLLNILYEIVFQSAFTTISGSCSKLEASKTFFFFQVKKLTYSEIFDKDTCTPYFYVIMN